MKEKFNELENLSAIDVQLVSLKRKIDAGPKEIEIQKQHCEAIKAARAEVQEACKRCASQIDILGLEVKSLEAEAKELDQKIGIVKNSKEYKIITERIKDVKKIINENEQRELELMEELENLKKVLSEKNEQVEVEEEKLNSVCDNNRIDAQEVKVKQQELIAQRKEQIEKINSLDIDLMKVYSQALRRGKGYALAALKHAACQKCYRKVSVSVENNVRAQENIEKCLCPGCGRILYYVDEEVE